MPTPICVGNLVRVLHQQPDSPNYAPLFSFLLFRHLLLLLRVLTPALLLFRPLVLPLVPSHVPSA
jgi:hypothetical protein